MLENWTLRLGFVEIGWKFLEIPRNLAVIIRKQVCFFQKCIFGGNGSNDHAKLKSENGFEKQNGKLVHKCGFRFSVRASEQAEQKNRFLGIWARNPEFS